MSGCNNTNDVPDKFLNIRQKALNCDYCQFDAAVTIDYGDATYSFSVACKTDVNNNMNISVIKPELISGVHAKISGGSGKIVFDEEAIAFQTIANDQIAPICIPWLLMKSLYGGYMSSYGSGNNLNFVRIDDNFNQTEYSVELWLDEANIPSEAEILWDGKRIASLTIDNFVLV